MSIRVQMGGPNSESLRPFETAGDGDDCRKLPTRKPLIIIISVSMLPCRILPPHGSLVRLQLGFRSRVLTAINVTTVSLGACMLRLSSDDGPRPCFAPSRSCWGVPSIFPKLSLTSAGLGCPSWHQGLQIPSSFPSPSAGNSATSSNACGQAWQTLTRSCCSHQATIGPPTPGHPRSLHRWRPVMRHNDMEEWAKRGRSLRWLLQRPTSQILMRCGGAGGHVCDAVLQALHALLGWRTGGDLRTKPCPADASAVAAAEFVVGGGVSSAWAVTTAALLWGCEGSFYFGRRDGLIGLPSCYAAIIFK